MPEGPNQTLTAYLVLLSSWTPPAKSVYVGDSIYDIITGKTQAQQSGNLGIAVGMI